MPSRDYSLYGLINIGGPVATLTLTDADDKFFDVPDQSGNNQTTLLDGKPVKINAIEAAVGPQLVVARVNGVRVELNLTPVRVTVESRLIDSSYIVFPGLPPGATVLSVNLLLPFPDDVALALCFGGDSLIETGHGPVRAAAIAPGDRLRTLDGRLVPVRWVGRQVLDFLRRSDMARFAPVVFEPCAIDGRSPARRLLLSPQHRVLMRGWKAQLYFGEEEVLAPARALVNGTTVRQDTGCARVEYVHILCDAHELVLAEGAAVETLFLGDVALSEETGPIREELLALFPELEEMAARMRMARMPLKVCEARLLADS